VLAVVSIGLLAWALKLKSDRIPLDQPLSPLAQAFVLGCLALAEQLGQTVPSIKDPAALNGAEGLELVHQAAGHRWPGIKHSTAA
jgi:hypothetical protein